MKKIVLAAVTACALCCIPLFIPVIAGLSVFGYRLTGAPLSLDTILCALALALLVVVAVLGVLKVLRGSAKARCWNTACTSSSTCGCK